MSSVMCHCLADICGPLLVLPCPYLGAQIFSTKVSIYLFISSIYEHFEQCIQLGHPNNKQLCQMICNYNQKS